MQTTADLGDLRERFGRMQGSLEALEDTIKRIETKVDDNQRVNVAAHERQDKAIADLSTRLTAKLAEDNGSHRTHDKYWGLLTGSVAGGVVTFLLEYFGKH